MDAISNRQWTKPLSIYSLADCASWTEVTKDFLMPQEYDNSMINQGKTKAKRYQSKFVRLYGKTLQELAAEAHVLPEVWKRAHGYDRWKKAYYNALQRCNYRKDKKFRWYGAKAIKCELSMDQIAFLYGRDRADLMRQPSLDRKDNAKNYSLENCQFIEMSKNRVKRG